MSRNFRLPCTIELQPLSLTPLKMRKVEFRRGVCRWAATVAMAQSFRPALTIGRQDAPGVSRGHSHQLGCLAQGHVLCCQAV